jgi:Fic family protein
MPTWEVHFDCRLDLQNREIISSVATVEALAKVIHGIPLPPATQRRIDTLNILRAIRGTTGIEGTEVSEAEVDAIMRMPQKQVLPEARHRAEQEVRNAAQVMEFVAATLKQNPNHVVNEELIRTIHRLTTQGIDYPHNEPGVYRSHGVVVGTYVPPRTNDEVRRLMTRFIEWYNGPPLGWPAPIRAVVAHFYLISIHPFGDGNGRTARGLESFLLYQGGVNARGFYSLANYYYQNRSEYVAMLDYVRFETNDDITPFVRFALVGLVAEQEMVHQEILADVTIIAFRDFARQQLDADGKLGTKPGERMFHFLLGLPDEPVSVMQLRKGGHPLSQLYHGLTARTLSRDLNYLSDRELIKIDEHNRIHANVEIMKEFM